MEIFSAACYTTSLEIDIKIETKILSNPCLAKGIKKSSKKKKQRQFEILKQTRKQMHLMKSISQRFLDLVVKDFAVLIEQGAVGIR